MTQRRFAADVLGFQRQPTKLIERPSIHLIADRLVDGNAFAGQRALINGRDTVRHPSVNWDTFARSDHHNVAHVDIIERHVCFAVIANDMCNARTEIEDAAYLALGAVNRVTLDALATKRDKHHERGGFVFRQHNRGQRRQCQCQVRSNTTFKQVVQRLVQDPGTTGHRRQQGEPAAEDGPVLTPNRVTDQTKYKIAEKQPADDCRQQIDWKRSIVKPTVARRTASGVVREKLFGGFRDVVHWRTR